MKTKLVFLAIALAATTALSQTFPVADPDEAIAIEEGKTYTVRGVVNIVHFPIADGDQHGTEQGSVTVGYFLLFTPERYSPRSARRYHTPNATTFCISAAGSIFQ